MSLLLCATANHFLPLLSTSYADQPACQANSVFSVHKMWISINRKFFSRRYDRMCFQNFRIPICSATLSNNYYTSTVRAGLVFLSFVGTAFRGRPPMERVPQPSVPTSRFPRSCADISRREAFASRENPTCIGPVLPYRSLPVCPLPARVLFPSNPSCVIVWVSRLEPNAKELSHGMDNTSARRNRSELRSQLVRQRRTLA